MDLLHDGLKNINMEEESFFSINRLIEFGMSVSIAQQMVNTMNESINKMQIPGSMNQMNNPQNFYYVILDGKQAGPFSESEVIRLFFEKKIDKNTYFWKTGMTNWLMAENIPSVLKLIALAPPPFIQNT